MTDPHVDSDGGGETSSTLLFRIKHDDQDAWRRFERLYKPLMYQWCRRFRLPDDAAAEVTQNAFVTVIQKIGEFHHDRDGDSLRGWLHKITRWRVMDYLRDRRTQVNGVGGTDAHKRLQGIRAPDPDPYPDPDTIPDSVQTDQDPHDVRRRALEEVLPDFHENTREAFLRVFIEKRSPVHVAEDLGMSVNAVYQAKKHVLDRLNREFPGIMDG